MSRIARSPFDEIIIAREKVGYAPRNLVCADKLQFSLRLTCVLGKSFAPKSYYGLL